MDFLTVGRRLWRIALRELRVFARRPLYRFCIVAAPLMCLAFFPSLMDKGLPVRLPAAVVDLDNTKSTRTLCRALDAMEMADVRYRYRSFAEAHEAMRRGDIYAFLYIPQGATRMAIEGRQPRVSFYTNDTYLVPANLLMKDLKTASELMGLALTRERMRGKGVPERWMMGILQPVVIETHPLGNPTLDYNVYLSNMLVPGIIILLILLTTTYSIGIEWKQQTQRVWYAMAGQSQTVALVGKLWPQTVVYVLFFWLMDVWFFVVHGFPCRCGIGAMMLLGVLTVLAAQGFGVFLFGLLAGQMRVAMCISSLWGILSFSLAGFTYPVTDMHPVLQALSPLFPLRHYYLIYVNQALNGYPVSSVWPSVVWLVGFCLLPLLMVYRYRCAFLRYRYLP